MWTSIVRFVCLVVIRLFYREIGTRWIDSESEIDLDAPTLVVANHPNGLMDPIVLRIALKREVGFLAKSTLFENWFGRTSMGAFSAIPVYRAKDGKDTSRNDVMFRAVDDALNEGKWIALFPEGVSHNHSQLLPLKTGAARMFFEARDSAPGVQILPLGLDYEKKEQFRSRVSVTVGRAIKPAESDTDVRELTDEIATALKEITVEAGSPEIRDGFLWVATWLEGDGASVQQIGAHAQKLSDAFGRLIATDRAAADALVEEVREFVRALASVGLEAWEVDERLKVRAFIPYLFGAPFAFLGALLSYPTYRAIRPFSEMMAKGERDLISTIKALAGLLFFPLTWGAQAFIAWQIDPRFGLVVLFLAAPLSLFAIQYFERLEIRRSAIRAFGLRNVSPDVAKQILAQRTALAERINAQLEQLI